VRSLIAKSSELSFVNSEVVKPYYIPEAKDATLVFESRFECGNLSMAAKVSDSEYNLLLQNDVNSRGHTQWFFFRVTNTTKDLRVKFNILNLVKGASLYNQGMQVAVHSQHSLSSEGHGWFRGGEEVSYFPNHYRREHVSAKTYYSMTFTYVFTESHDTVFFAYAVPYTYTQLNDFLKTIESDSTRCQFVTRKTLCRTLAGNKCEYLTITNPGTRDEIDSRRGVVVSARVHPGETVGSWMMHGLLDFLTSTAPEANTMRDLFLFKIVPMLNPDGVVNGNHRTNLTGADLNRRWKYPSKLLHPTIYSMKRMIKSFASESDLEIICDFHGHSRKKNVFIYGCNIPKDPQVCKLFPFVLSKVNPNFSFKDCRFGVQKSKEATLRVSLFKELRMPKVYTLEASFAGADLGPQANTHFTTKQLEEMGRDFLLAVLVCNPTKLPLNPKLNTSLRSHQARALKSTPGHTPEPCLSLRLSGVELNADSLRAELLQDDELLMAGEEACSSDDSDSEPSEDNLEVAKLNKLIPKEARVRQKSLPRGDSLRRKSQRTTATAIKKCTECGETLTKNHTCSSPAPPPLPPPQLPPRRPIGVRTYYNKFGKKVHDQESQTPSSFYTKSAHYRLNSLSRLEDSGEDSLDLLHKAEITRKRSRLDMSADHPDSFVTGVFKPTNSAKGNSGVSARSSINSSPTKRSLLDRPKQSPMNSLRPVVYKGTYSRAGVKSSSDRRM
jgi:ribosomal protein L32